jgi:hypothetical protein
MGSTGFSRPPATVAAAGNAGRRAGWGGHGRAGGHGRGMLLVASQCEVQDYRRPEVQECHRFH